MVSKNQAKLIQKLQQKKYRLALGMFIVEGKKSILEFIKSGWQSEMIFVTHLFSELLPKAKTIVVQQETLQKYSLLKNPDEGLAVFRIQQVTPLQEEGLILALDDVRDPGNLGTIIRLCDWFGVKQLVCSTETVDCFNPKVVQATMGSLTRVEVHYLPLGDFLKNTQLPVYAAVMEGENVYQTQLKTDAVLLMGNEANGISQENLSFVTSKVTIPRFGVLQQAESLNVATATAILLSEFKRR
ncbi:RNA methyltransferase [Capnocytophaga canimorsus]|uniref:RNA methyltransferase n=1 Tax=Capnocytophaga canimorsus TaxID=28188 RepID=A0A250G5G1_9FLAO|nr:RNA methyltransferase [Capnocytophaga canimorsus]ATA91476.1 RNA methyltransferase [Capnocytophaga canimorsus]